MSKDKKRYPLEKGGLLESFDHAFRGIMSCARRERNFRIHLLVGLLALVCAIFLGLKLVEFLVLILIISAVLTAEIFNTALEKTLNLLAPEKKLQVREIKNLCAAGVLITVFAALFTGYLLLSAHLPGREETALAAITQSPWYVTVIGLLATTALVLFLKIKLRSRSLFRGGMPSGHSAFSFAVLAVVFFTTGNLMATVLVFTLALLVAQSRVRRKIHTWPEVIYGGILGFGVVMIIFQLLYHPGGLK